jgi:urea transport system permease protein
VGAILGAVLVNFGKTYFTGALPELWLFALGGLFIFVTLLLPKGVMGLFARRERRKISEASEAAVSAAKEVTG